MTEVMGHTRILATVLLGIFFIGICIMALVRPDIFPVYTFMQRARLLVSLVVGIALIIEALNLFSRVKK